jgi:hypothetical protein
MSAFRRSALVGLLVLAGASSALAQTNIATPINYQVNMSGPRFGLTLLSDGNVAKINEELNVNVRPLISQFGWQFEKQVYNGGGNGFAILSEWIPVIGGMDQGLFLPSLNWLVGARSSSGTEFGIGPNITPLGVGLVVAGGVTVRSNGVNIPLNFAVASGKSGVRVSIMTGFNVRK